MSLSIVSYTVTLRRDDGTTFNVEHPRDPKPSMLGFQGAWEPLKDGIGLSIEIQPAKRPA